MKEKFATSHIISVTALKDSVIHILPLNQYLQLAFDQQRSYPNMLRILTGFFPSLPEKSKFKREQIINSFEEVLLEKD
jgi:hypothetical protein